MERMLTKVFSTAIYLRKTTAIARNVLFKHSKVATAYNTTSRKSAQLAFFSATMVPVGAKRKYKVTEYP